MYGFLAGFSFPESILLFFFLFPVCHHFSKNRKYVNFSKIALFPINCYFIGYVSPMYGFLAGFSFPESILLFFFLFPVCHHFSKNRKYVNFSKIALFPINCYFIGYVSPMYGFLAGFSFPESILLFFFLCPVCHHFSKNRKYVNFSKIALFHINFYFIGYVSPMYGFLAGFSFPESILLFFFLFPVLSPLFKKQEICKFFQNRIISHQFLLHR